MLSIEIVCGDANRQELIQREVDEGATARQAVVECRKLQEAFPGLDLLSSQLGVWGQPVSDEHLLQDGDRVEVYRPLQLDPREARRELARAGGFMGTGGQTSGDSS